MTVTLAHIISFKSTQECRYYTPFTNKEIKAHTKGVKYSFPPTPHSKKTLK